MTTRVNINGSGHQVEIQHDGADLSYVVEKVQKLWTETVPDQPEPGPAYGFTAQVGLTRNGPDYRQASFRHGEQPVVDR